MHDATYACWNLAPPGDRANCHGPNVHLLDDPVALAWLPALAARETTSLELGRLVRWLYEHLSLVVLGAEFPRRRIDVPSRMVAVAPEVVYRGVAIDRFDPVVTVGIARAGTVPSQICYETLNELPRPRGRAAGSPVHVARHRRQGTGHRHRVARRQIGHQVAGRIVLIPDLDGRHRRARCRPR